MQIAMTEEQFQMMVGKAKAQGIELEGRGGLIEKMGVKAKWAFDGAMLTVEGAGEAVLPVEGGGGGEAAGGAGVAPLYLRQ